MKKSFKIILVIIFIIILVIVAISIITLKRYKEFMTNMELSEFQEKAEDKNTDTVIIKNKDIFGEDAKTQNLNLIDEFLKKIASSNSEETEISLKICEYKSKETYDEIFIKYTPGNKLEKETENLTICFDSEGNFDEYYKKQFGYYTIIFNNDETTKKEYNKLDWNFKKVTIDNKVNLCLYKHFLEKEELPVICTFDLSETEYEKNIDLSFNQRKDIGIKKVITKEENDEGINVYTFGGDVKILAEEDMVYNLEDALKQNIITIDDILKQASLDTEYGFCESGYYSDGGSIEYLYSDYTILKYNTLDGKGDLVIGFSGQIINKFNDELKKTQFKN